MYIMTIENGNIDLNDSKELQETGYLQDDITNGNMVALQYIPTLKEVKRIIKLVRKTAIQITVWKMVTIPNDKKLQKQLDSNPWN